MASDTFGISFAPTDQNAIAGRPGGGAAGAGNNSGPTPVQSAIQTLSLRIPHVAGAQALAPQPLLDSPGSAALGGNPNSASILEMLRRLFAPAPGTSGVPGAEPQSPTVYGHPTTPTFGMPSDVSAPAPRSVPPPHFIPTDNSPPMPAPNDLTRPSIVTSNPPVAPPAPNPFGFGGGAQRNKQV